MLTGRFAKKRLEKARGQKPTKLLVDQLEERQLLSLTVGTTDNILVNDGWQDVRGEIAVDSNNSGDMIVAWTGADRLANPDYDATDPESSPYLLDENGEYVEDLNVYARYLTNEVQIVTIPQELVPGSTLADGTTVQSGTFELVYNAYETQRFSIYKSIFAQGDEEDAYPTTNSLTCFNLGFYAEGELTWILFKYDSALLPSDNAANLESAIRAIPGGEYANATVTAVSETDFDITFYGGNGVDFAGQNLSDIKVRNDYYNDLSGIIEKVKAADFDASDLRSCTSFQKMILKDLFGDNYQKTVEQTMATQGKKTVVKVLETELDAQSDVISSGVVTTVDQVQKITTYSSKTGAALGINVAADPWQTAKNIQDAFNAVSAATLYAPVTRGYVYDEATHTYTYTELPARAYSSDQAYGEMQAKIPAIEVSVVPVPGTTNQFQITFVGADGLQDQDALIVSAGTYVTKTKVVDPTTGKATAVYDYVDVITRDSQTGEYGHADKTYSPYAQTIKENSSVFRVNASEVADFVVDEDGDVVYDREGTLATNGTGRTNQMKPDVAMSADGTFVVVWESENDDATQPYNKSDIMARRFVVQGYVDETDPNYEKLSFYDNGAENGFVGYVPPETAYSQEVVNDPYALNARGEKVQCVAPVANEFVVNASTNGRQTDPTIGADKDGAFIVAWTSEAQTSSYFGGIYARQFDSLAQPLTGDITLASSRIGTNYYGPADAAMSDDGFAVVAWNYNTSHDGAATLYHSVLEPQSAKFVVDHEVVANGGYNASVSFTYGLLDNETGRYSARYGIAWTQQEGAAEEDDDDAAANAVLDVTLATLPATNVSSAVYELTGNMLENEIIVNAGDDDDDATGDEEDEEVISGDVIHVGTRETSSFVATAVQEFVYDSAGNQGNPSIALDADGDVFLAYQGFNSLLDIQSTTNVDMVSYLLEYDDYEGKYATYPADSEGLAIRLAWSDFEANLVYKNKTIDYGDGKFAYEDKNEDLVDFVKLALGWGYDEDGELVEFGGDALYGVAKADCIDVDTYERRFLAVAQKEGATVEQLTRLHAVLEALLSPLRNNGNDVTLRTWNQGYYASGVTATAGEGMGLVSNLRDGSNACFYLAFPNNYVASATTTLWLGRQDNADNALPLGFEEVAIDLSGQYNADFGGIILNPTLAAQAVADALNASALANGDPDAFVARYVPLSEVEFYKGTLGEIDVNMEAFEYSATVDDVVVNRRVEDYFVVQIVAQSSLHDTPLHIYQAATGTSVKLLNQTSEDADYWYETSLFVERNGSLGTAQTNPSLVSTSNGDLTVAWGARASSDPRVAYNTYPNVGNPIDAAFTHIYVRPFVESTDNAGPTVVNVSLPNGDKVQEGEMVTSALRDVVVSFSEEMLTMGDGSNYYNKLHAVDNIANWTLLCGGVEVTGAIESVTFGMNASQQLAKNTVDENGNAVEEINDGVLAYGTNRWEAVVTFAEGFELNDGDYTLVCSAMVQDIARNAIYSQGYAVDGSGAGFDGRDWKLDFSVVRLNEALGFEYGDGFHRDNYIPEDYIEYDPNAPSHEDGVYGPVVYQDYSSLKQVTRSSILNETSDYGPNTAQSVASNANGDFVTTWVETLEEIDKETGNKTVTQTVWAKAYRALYVMNADGVREQIIDHSEEGNYVVVKVTEATAEFEATTNKKGETVFELVEGSATLNGEKTKEFADPRQASVAIADRGEFVVVWDMITDGDEEDGSRDVYMAKYAFNGGQMKINGKTEAERVNIETDKDQQYAAVAMDADGDVVVVWESYEQDGSGWGVYGRRFMTDGFSFGYSNTIQKLTFGEQLEVEGDKLNLKGNINDVDFDITIDLTVEMKKNAESIEQALIETGLLTENDVTVAVTAAGEISIEFKGALSATFVDLMEAEWMGNQTDENGDTAIVEKVVNLEMQQIGKRGSEFSVNETTDNNQRFASIAMERDGGFVVSWTSWGQDDDSAVESNIYARKFASNHLVSKTVGTVEDMTPVADDRAPQIVTNGDIDSYEATGDMYSSVAYIQVGGLDTGDGGEGEGGEGGDLAWTGSGSLLSTGMHVLTAAHVVCNEDGTLVDLEETPMYVTFHTSYGAVNIEVEDIFVHETYTGDPIYDDGVDLAVITLKNAAPTELKGYELYDASDEIGQRMTMVGYGLYGEADETVEEAEARESGVKHFGDNVFELTGAEFAEAAHPNLLVYDLDDGTAANDYFGNYYGIVDRGLGEDEAGAAQGDSGGPALINNKIAGVCSWGRTPSLAGGYGVYVRVSAYVDWINEAIMSGLGGEFLVNTDLTVTVDAEDDDAATDDEDVVVELNDSWTKGNQIWSSVAMDSTGNFVVTWTGYNQDGNGDSLTGASNNGLGGVFGRVFSSDPNSPNFVEGNVFQVNEYTAYDQIHSQVAMDSVGNFVVVYESYQDPSNDENSDVADNYGIYARRYEVDKEDVTLTVNLGTTAGDDEGGTDEENEVEIELTVLTEKALGSEFRVTRDGYYEFDKDQLGGSVAVDANGDMVFVWTDLSEPRENVDAVVRMRSLTLPDDELPPYVVRANAAFEAAEKEQQVSLYGNQVTFATGHAPHSLVYSFSEYMYSAQYNVDAKKGEFEQDDLFGYALSKSNELKSAKSVLNLGNWSLTHDGKTVTTDYVLDIIYGYNASTRVDEYLAELGMTESDPNYKWYRDLDEGTRTNSYELVIVFKKVLPDGAYVMTLSDATADVFSNRLDGDYDGESGGAFMVRFNVGAGAKQEPGEDPIDADETESFAGALYGQGEPIVVSNEEGFIIVTESQVLYELGSNDNNNNNNNNNGTDDETNNVYGSYETVTIDGVTYRIESDIVMRRFKPDGTPVGVETRVNNYTTGNQIDPDIALTESGSYVVAWAGESEDALDGVCARFYPGGAAQAKQIQIAGRKGIRCWNPDVQINEATGLVLISWIQGATEVDAVGNPKADKVCGVYYDVNGKQLSDVFTIAEDGAQSIESFDVESVKLADGSLQYVVAWTSVNTGDWTRDVYQRVLVAQKNAGGKYGVVETVAKTRVNDTASRGQYEPQIAIVDDAAAGADLGKYYIVWVSDQVINDGGKTNNGADIYARAYNADGSSAQFFGTTGEALVNKTIAHRQYMPSVDANSDGVGFTWTSYDIEEFNYDPISHQVQHDDGVCVRVFNNAGQPVDLAGLASTDNEYVLNVKTVAGNQDASSIAMFQWEDADGDPSTPKTPKFVVAWRGPNEFAGYALEDPEEGGTGNGTGNETGNEEGSAAGYMGPYSVFHKLISSGASYSKGDQPIVTATTERFSSNVANESGSDGFYRPVDGGELVAAAGSVASSKLNLTGTSGDDEIVVETNASGVATIKINGKTQTVPTGTTAIVVDGLGGKDSIVYKSTASNAVKVDATNGTLLLDGAISILATNVEAANLDGVGALEISATATGDYVELSADAAKATSAEGFELTAKNFASVSALGGGKASATVLGTNGDDVVSATATTVATTGVELKNFANVRIDGGAGNDVATIEGANALNASENVVVATTSKSTLVAFGFETVEAKGAGVATANVYGSRGDDALLADATTTEMVYATGTILKTSGFNTTNVFGNGGADRASLFAGSGLNTFDGRANQATLTNGSFARKLNGFSNVAVFGSEEGKLVANLYDSIGDDAFVLAQDSATMDVDGANLYSILAADQVKVKREAGRGDDSIEEAETLDYLFSTENWDF